MLGGSDGAFGRSLSLHRGTFSSGGWLWYIGAVLLAAGVLNLAQAVGLSVGKGTPTGTVGMAFGCFVGSFLLLIVPVTRWRQQVELFEGGFVWSRLTGKLSVPRNEVQGTQLITHHSRSGSHVEVVVHLASGRELSMSGLSQADQLANMLSAYSRPLAPAVMAGAPGGWRPPAG